MNLRITLLAFLCLCATAILRAERVDMLKAGAKANGKALNTKLINSTIDRLNRGGGGTLFFPAGTYLTGSIHLKSNITLELEAGAILLFSDNFDDYLPFVEVRHEGVMMVDETDTIYVKFIQSDSEDAFKIISTGGTYSIRQANPITQKYINLGITKFVLVPEDVEQGIYKVEAFSPNNKNHM